MPIGRGKGRVRFDEHGLYLKNVPDGNNRTDTHETCRGHFRSESFSLVFNGESPVWPIRAT
ncbi:hypothetical protein DSCW_43840 [Desulfosarcina widdelii]|uniref:Uncharacterized protein n=1 Tax=Desulfosarcina widdelii TaxID=947919 RepID=A0A5K7ZLQ5_9BACT|nr:hypothetical protein [Desulfosarcina widdelii]BBO76967.1 hypothetical protein DSCW_43840 [Desulfosarcina widdelii]